MKKEILLFVQAAADLKYALEIFSSNTTCNFHICVVHVKGIYNYLLSLNLCNVRLSFYDYITFNHKSISSISLARKQFNDILSKEFMAGNYQKVYFFSIFFDWFTTGIVGRLSNNDNIEVNYIDHYDYVAIKHEVKINKKSFSGSKTMLYNRILTWITGIKFSARYTYRTIIFCYEKYTIKKTVKSGNVDINDKFKFNLNLDKRNTVLMFISPDEISMLTKKSEEKLYELVHILKSENYSVALKGHPRIGDPVKLSEMVDITVPNNIPSEFLNYNDIKFCLGLVSTALVYVAKNTPIPTFSMIELLDFRSEERRVYFKNYLKELAGKEIRYISLGKKINEILVEK